jgi:hypothetical protein
MAGVVGLPCPQWIEMAWAWFSTFLKNPLVRRVTADKSAGV